MKLQSWTKVLATVLQYSYFSVISRFPLKTVHPFHFLAVVPSPTLYKVETRYKILDTRVQHCLCSEGRGLDLCALEIAPETQKCPKTLVHDCRYIKANIKYNNYSSLPFKIQLLKAIK